MDFSEEVKALMVSPLTVALNEEQILLLLKSGKIENYKTGDVIIKEGEPGDSLYIILEGNVVISSPPDDELAKLSEADTLSAQYEGDFFGEMSIIDLEPRSATVNALKNVKVLKIKREKLGNIFSNDKDLQMILLINMTRTLSRRLRSTNIRKKDYVKKYKENLAALNKSEKNEQVLIDWMIKLQQLNKELQNEVLHRKRAERKIKKLAVRDSLTNLLNHREFYRLLEEEIKRAKRYNLKFAVLVIDLDDFKKINDIYGHRIGDKVLNVIAKLLQRNVRGVDYLARYGGDEFVILMPEINKKDGIVAAKRLANTLAKIPITITKNKVEKITLTVGIAGYPEDGITSSNLVQNADNAMYLGKRSGKCIVQIYKKPT